MLVALLMQAVVLDVGGGGGSGSGGYLSSSPPQPCALLASIKAKLHFRGKIVSVTLVDPLLG